MSDIVVRKEQGICQVVFNRPDKKNAITADMYQIMADAINSASDDTEIKVIVILSENGHFTAGNDLGDFLKNPSMDESSAVYQFLKSLITCKLPLLAAVDGFAVGIGTTMLLHCERVFATPEAKFSLPFVNLGLVPEAGSSLLLPNLVGYQQAAHWLLTGEAFDGVEAFEAGLVSECVPQDEVNDTCLAYAKKLTSKPRHILLETKRLLRKDSEPLQERVADELKAFVEALNGAAAKEAMTAFMEKRKPDFTQL